MKSPVASGVWLGLRALAPVGDGPSDDDFPVAELPNVGCGGGALIPGARRAPCPPSPSTGGIPPPRARGPPAAEPLRGRESLTHRETDSWSAESGRDLVVVESEVPQAATFARRSSLAFGRRVQSGGGTPRRRLVNVCCSSAEDRLDLSIGLAFAAEGCCLLAQTIKLFFSSHNRILGRASDIRRGLSQVPEARRRRGRPGSAPSRFLGLLRGPFEGALELAQQAP